MVTLCAGFGLLVFRFGLTADRPSCRISRRIRRRPTRTPSRWSATCSRRLPYTGWSVKIRSSRFSRSSSSADSGRAGNKSCCARSPTASIAGLRTAPPSARSSPASQQSGDGGLPGKKIPLDLQLTDLPMQIVDYLLRIVERRRLVAAHKKLTRALHQLLLPAADHRRMNPKFHRQLRQGLLPRKRRHRHARLELRAVLLPLYTHLSRLFGPVSL